MKLRVEPTSAPLPGGEDIAIVGMSCLFPGADSPERFWHNIVNKVDSIATAPPDWQPDLFFDPAGAEVDRTYTTRGGFLGDLCRFNPLKYGVPPSAIDGAEPDHFVALRCAYEAFQDAGVPRLPINRAKTAVILGRGIFVNRGWVTIFQRTFAVDQVLSVLRQLEPDRSEQDLEVMRVELKKRLPPGNADTFPGVVHSALVGRIANRLDLNGPAYTIDAACSSTLLAVEHGVRELRSGRCDAVLAGGTQVSTPGMVHVMFCQLQALSRSGKIAPFSAHAEGTLLGQGCGMLLLKRRRDAENDGNRIYALIKAVGTSSDGNGVGLLAPRTEGQQLSIRRAYGESGISTDSVQLLEAHGTGIPLGDSVEINSLHTCFGKPKRGQPDVAIGSIKSMIGHLLPASAAASLIKTTLALYHRTLPPTLHAESENPQLELNKTRFYLATEPRPWIHGGAAPRRAGVNAFGFGGINGHAILEEYPTDEAQLAPLLREWPCELIVVSGDSTDDLCRRVQMLLSWLERSPDVSLLDVAATCAEQEGESRLAIVAKSSADLLKKVGHAAKLLAEPGRERIQDRSGIFWYKQPLAPAGRVAFVFPGEGSQYVNMLGELCQHFPEVRHQFDLTSQAFEQRGKPFAQVVFPQPATAKRAESELFSTEVAIASVTAAARGLWRLMQRFNVAPDAVVGHSSGEYAAHLASGACARQDDAALVQIIAAGTDSAAELRASHLMPRATLLSVGGVPDDVLAEALADHASDVVVAMDNCPHQRILAGSEKAIADVLSRLQGKGGLCQKLTWDRPYHTAAFDPALPIVKKYIDFLDLRAPQIESWSCATAARIPASAEATRELALRQWSSPVRFSETILAMHDAGIRVFVEVGPRGNLSAFINDTLARLPHTAVALDVPNKSGIEQLCRAMGMLVAQGVPVAIRELFSRRVPRRLDFASDPPKPKRAEPRLPLELPLLQVDEAVAEQWRRGQTPRPKTLESVPQVATPPALSSRAEISHALTAQNRHAAPSNGNGQLLGEPRRSQSQKLVKQRVPLPKSMREAAHADFQHTLQRFLVTQQSIAQLCTGKTIQHVHAPALDALPVVARRDEREPVTARTLPGNGSAGQTKQIPHTRVAPENHASSPRSQPMSNGAAPITTTPIRPASVVPTRWPFMETVLECTPGTRLVVECELSVEKNPFLRDHTFFGRHVSDQNDQLTALPIMPLAMTLEFMAEAASTLYPQQHVTALSDILVSRWLPIHNQSRRVRIIATSEHDTAVHVSVVEADTDGAHEIASSRVELSHTPGDLGPVRLPVLKQQSPPWRPEDVYGKFMYHGPAFQGIDLVEDWGPKGVRAGLHQPDTKTMWADQPERQLILPVALIDVASQLPGIVNANWAQVGTTCRMAFPNKIERLEISQRASVAGPLVGTATIDQSTGKLLSDTEIVNGDGEVILRYLGKVEEIVDFPLALYRYGFEPHLLWCAKKLNELFAGVPRVEQCWIGEAVVAVPKLLVKSFWATVVARLILNEAERVEFDRLKLPPVALVDWLLGRLVAKEASRAHSRMSGCLADIQIQKDVHGQPRAVLPGGESIQVSLAHKNFFAVAVAAAGDHFQGVGIDCESLLPLPANVLADAFDAEEIAIVDAAARQSGQSIDAWRRGGWCVKEAVGKALGRGVLGGPRNIQIVRCDAAARQITVKLRGAMASNFPSNSHPHAGSIDAYWREHEQRVLGLCLLPKLENH